MNDSGTSASICAETEPAKGLTLAGLIEAYQTDRVSTYHALRYHTRKNAASILKRLAASHGQIELKAIKRRELTEWYMDWAAGGKFSMAHAFIAQIRTMLGFGASMLEHPECERLSMVLHRMRFQHGAPRSVHMTADQANAIRDVARAHFGWPSIALAQSIQFELLLRQGDVIGSWVPESEPGESDVRRDGEKWGRGLRWEEIDKDMILRHVTSKRQKLLEIDLKLAPMLISELEMDGFDGTRASLPAFGPMVICDTNGLPWTANEFRRKWRLVANKAEVPKTIKSMDSRAGGITEATEAGADLEHVKHAATHSDIAQTQRYSRNATDKIASVQNTRIQHRAKKKMIHGD